MALVGVSSKIISGFDPRSAIPGCVLWLDAADANTITLSGSNVTGWNDKSGNNNHFVQSTSSAQPTYISNSLSFNGTSNYLYQSNTSQYILNNLSAWTIFSVQTINTAAGGTQIVYRYGIRGILYESISTTYYFFNYSPIAVSGSGDGIAAVVVANATETGYINGVSQGSATGPTTTGQDAFTLGASNASSGFLNGYIYEIIMFNTALTTAQRQQVEGYLAAKWGLQSQLNKYFLPTTISGCKLWLDATDSSTLTLSGSNVTQWNDKSGNGNNTNSTTGTPVLTTNAINGQSAISFNSLSWFFGPASNTGTTLTAIGVGTMNGSNGVGARSDYIRMVSFAVPNHDYDSTANAAAIIRYQSSNSVVAARANADKSPVAVSLGTPFLAVSIFDGTNQTMYVNGVAGTSSSSTGNFGYSQYGIGHDPGGDNTPWNGYIGEVIVYNGALTTAQRQQIEGYLAKKWGISTPNALLPTTHPYYYVQPYTRVFQPTDIGSCILWLDGADTSSMTFSSGSNISQWNDKSGNGNNATANGTPVLSNSSLNGYQSIYTNNSPYFTGPVLITGTTFTCFAVATTTASLPLSGHDQRLVSLENGGNVDYGRTDGAIALFNQGGTSWIGTWRVNPSPVADSPITTNIPFLAVSEYDGTNGYLWKNGSTGSLASSSSTGTFAVTKYGIGNQANNSGEYWIGYIGEVIIYNTALTTGQRQQVEGYLSWKWGLNGQLNSFSPLSIGNCKLWLDANDSSTVTGTTSVTLWKDKSSNSYSFAVPSGLLSPSYGTDSGGLKSINFTSGSTATGLSSAVSFPLSSSSFFIVLTVPSYLGSAKGIFTAAGSGGNDYQDSNGFDMDDNGYLEMAQNNNFNINAFGTQTVRIICSFGWNGSAFTTYVNGSQYYSATFGKGTATLMVLGARIVSGSPYASGFNATCTINEVIGYSSYLSTTNRQQVESYLSRKWSVSVTNFLTPTHPYRTLPPSSVRDTTAAIPTVFLQALGYSGSGTWYDKSPNGFNATLENGTAAKNTAGNGIVLNGSTNWTFSTISAGSKWSIAVWYKNTGNPVGSLPCILTQNYGPSAINITLGYTPSLNVAFFDGSSWRAGTTITFTNNVWTHVIGTWDGTTMSTYINGSLLGSTTPGSASSDGGTAYRIGRRWDYPDYMVGEIGEVVIYKQLVLTKAQIYNEYISRAYIYSY